MAFDKKTDPEVSLQDEKIKSEKEKLLAEILNKDTDDTPDSEDQTVVINTDYDIPIEYSDSTSDSKADNADESDNGKDADNSKDADKDSEYDNKVIIASGEPIPKYTKSVIIVPVAVVLTILGVILGQMDAFKSGIPSASWLRYTYIGFGVVILFFGIKLLTDSIIDESAFTQMQMGKLITTGIYSKTRNPMYGGVILICTAALFFSGNAFMYVLPPLYVFIMFILDNKYEEQLLLERFEDEYKKYRRTTRILLPISKKIEE